MKNTNIRITSRDDKIKVKLNIEKLKPSLTKKNIIDDIHIEYYDQFSYNPVAEIGEYADKTIYIRSRYMHLESALETIGKPEWYDNFELQIGHSVFVAKANQKEMKIKIVNDVIKAMRDPELDKYKEMLRDFAKQIQK